MFVIPTQTSTYIVRCFTTIIITKIEINLDVETMLCDNFLLLRLRFKFMFHSKQTYFKFTYSSLNTQTTDENKLKYIFVL
jgi:hypothetical protein